MFDLHGVSIWIMKLLEVDKLLAKIEAELDEKNSHENIISEKDDFKERTFYKDKRGDKYYFDYET